MGVCVTEVQTIADPPCYRADWGRWAKPAGALLLGLDRALRAAHMVNFRNLDYKDTSAGSPPVTKQLSLAKKGSVMVVQFHPLSKWQLLGIR
jgi:hypothetical protein